MTVNAVSSTTTVASTAPARQAEPVEKPAKQPEQKVQLAPPPLPPPAPEPAPSVNADGQKIGTTISTSA